MSRGTPHHQRTQHPQKVLGRRAECATRYAGRGRTPQHPLNVIAGTDQDIEAKRARAARGERLYVPDDVLDDDSAGLLVQGNVRTPHHGANNSTIVTGEIADPRDGVRRDVGLRELEQLSLGGRVKQLRRNLGLSLRMLAEKVGVTKTAVIHWEANRFRPRMTWLVQLAEVFDVHPGTLLDGLDGNGRISCEKAC